MHSCRWQYRSHRRLQSVTLNIQEVKEMVMAINRILGVKVKFKAMVRDTTSRGSNVFNVRGGDIELMSAQAPLLMEIEGGGRHLKPVPKKHNKVQGSQGCW